MSDELDWIAIYEESQKAHADVYLALAKENAKREAIAHELLASELPNLIDVADWLQTQTQWSEITQLTSVLWDESEFLPDRGPGRQNLPLLEAGLEAARNMADQKAICVRLLSLGETHRALGEIESAITSFEEALHYARQRGDVTDQRLALYSLGLAWVDREVPKSFEYFQEAQNLPSSPARPQLEIDLLSGLAAALIQQQNTELAGTYIEQAYQLALNVQDVRRQADLCYQRGYLLTALTDYAKARENFEMAINLYAGFDHAFGQGRALQALGTLDVQLGRAAEGISELERALQILEDAGDEIMLPMTLIAIGQTHAMLNKKENALQNLERAQSLVEKYKANPRIAVLEAPLGQLLDYVRAMPSNS
jgi:tetratricopeptide (TPR) repeat protein